MIRHFVADIKERQDRGFIDKSIDANSLTLMVLAVSFYPRVFAAATKAVMGLSPTDPEFERRWSEFLRDLAKRF